MFERIPIAARERRWYATGTVNYAAAGAAHIVYLTLFLAFGVNELAAFNVASVALWAVALALHRRGWMGAALIVALVELVAHALAGSIVLGWQSGFSVFIAALPIYAQTFRAPRGLTIAAWSLIPASAAIVLTMCAPDTGRIPRELVVMWGVVNCLTFVSILIASLLVLDANATRLEAELANAHAASERLLMNTLPPPIATRLKSGESVIADGFPDVSVLFCDIVGFTSYAATVTPERLVHVLNAVFRRFDDLAAEHGLEKIKTIGDAYMVAAGVPMPVPDHALRAARMALGIRDALTAVNAELGTSLQVRIGIHSGPVVAGVIGKHKFAYDLWGDTVNTASRMESHGVVGEIQLSDQTRALLQNAYEARERGTVDVKGKGPTRVWLLGASRTA